MTYLQVVVMGVAGAGKTTIGKAVADRLGVVFVDADSLHPASNIAKMSSGTPLNDDDRWPWLDRVGDELAAGTDGIVIACSALKRSYRDRIRSRAAATVFVQLDGTKALLAERLTARPGHFMPPSLLDSQLATLEPLQRDERGFVVSIDATPAEIDESVVRTLSVRKWNEQLTAS